MIIRIPSNNVFEREYIIYVIFHEFLGINYKLEITSSIDDYEIVLDNGNKLIIEDHFFNFFKKDLEYLKFENIPKKIFLSKKEKNIFLIKKDIPIIYGTDKIIINDKQIICGIDIFASSFFMLTRWEEYVNKIKDRHGRFPVTESLAFKFDFLNRAIVNEYLEMLWNMLKFLGISQSRINRQFEFILTHDVDKVVKYSSVYKMLREVGKNLFKRKSIKLTYKSLLKQVKVTLGKEKDPYDTFDYLMDISDMFNIKSYFFLHSSKSSKKYDYDNDKFLKKIAHRILRRGHFLGYHPSYNSYNNEEIFKKDKEKIENIIEYKLKFGRQHYLRFEIPTTWQIWENNEMEWDSTLCYPEKEGFRCGICYTYSVFNIIERKRLNLKEKPLVIMDTTLVNYQMLNMQQIQDIVKSLMKEIKLYNGECVLLWHNSSFYDEYESYISTYENIFRLIKK